MPVSEKINLNRRLTVRSIKDMMDNLGQERLQFNTLIVGFFLLFAWGVCGWFVGYQYGRKTVQAEAITQNAVEAYKLTHFNTVPGLVYIPFITDTACGEVVIPDGHSILIQPAGVPCEGGPAWFNMAATKPSPFQKGQTVSVPRLMEGGTKK